MSGILPGVGAVRELVQVERLVVGRHVVEGTMMPRCSVAQKKSKEPFFEWHIPKITRNHTDRPTLVFSKIVPTNGKNR